MAPPPPMVRCWRVQSCTDNLCGPYCFSCCVVLIAAAMACPENRAASPSPILQLLAVFSEPWKGVVMIVYSGNSTYQSLTCSQHCQKLHQGGEQHFGCKHKYLEGSLTSCPFMCWFFFFETGPHCVALPPYEPPACLPRVGIRSMWHHAQMSFYLWIYYPFTSCFLEWMCFYVMTSSNHYHADTDLSCLWTFYF